MNFRNIGTLAVVGAIVSAGSASAQAIKIPEGTEFPVRIADKISSKTAEEGDRFTIVLAEDVKLPGGVILRAGYRGVGEVTKAEGNGMLGKAGKLSVRLNYLKVGDERIKLRATKGDEGKGNAANQVVGLVFIGVFAAFIKGHSAEIPKGTAVTAFADQDSELAAIPAPPPSDL